jgi:predicted methyltransferase
MMKQFAAGLIFGGLLMAGAALAPASPAAAQGGMTPDYQKLLAAPDRSDADKAKDAGRKPAEVMLKLGVKPGQVVIDIGSGGGYYAENFARVTQGDVYAVNHPGTLAVFPQIGPALDARIANGLPNLHPEVMEFLAIPSSWQADIVFMGEIYHDVIGKGWNPEATNAAIFKALKPGGLLVIEDHIAKAGGGVEAGSNLHRADPAQIRAEVEAAGFTLVEENYDLFANPDDGLDLVVFDPAIRGHTARVLFVFRKPLM